MGRLQIIIPCAHRWAFSIWGIIFALQGVGVIYQLMSRGYGQEGKKRIVNSVGEHHLRAACVSKSCTNVSMSVGLLHTEHSLG